MDITDLIFDIRSVWQENKLELIVSGIGFFILLSWFILTRPPKQPPPERR